MDFTHLRQHYTELLDYLERDGYTKSYIQTVRFDIIWILKNEGHKAWQSYLDAYYDRVGKSESELHKKNKKISFGAIQQFDLHEEFPTRRVKNSFIKRGAYHQLLPEFKEVIDVYVAADTLRGIKAHTISGNASAASCLFCFLQEKGMRELCRISEEDILAFFYDGESGSIKSSSYKKKIAAVLKAGIAQKEECRTLLAYLPAIRPKRKNIQFLTPEEAEAISVVLDDENSGLSLRNRAIGKLLFFTGMRPCDIAGMELGDIDWDADEIHIPQQKTDYPLDLPLTASIGNSIYDYLVKERPESPDRHLFLGENYPYYPFTAGAVYSHAGKIYKAASLRQNEGDRRGTHLFRYHVATSFLGKGIQRPVISQTLGHASPNSLDSYLHADIIHLKECALSVDVFPLSEEVFQL